MTATINTLAYSKALQESGVDRNHAEAHAQAMVDHIMPQLTSKADLDSAVHTMTVRTFTMLGFFTGLLFALLKFG